MNNTNLPGSSCLFRLSLYHPGVSQRAAVSFGQSQGMTHRPSGLTKVQFKLLQMEIGAQNQGLSRTQLTPDRVSVALSVMLTKQVCNILYKCIGRVRVQCHFMLMMGCVSDVPLCHIFSHYTRTESNSCFYI